jgi:hypothetical protein
MLLKRQNDFHHIHMHACSRRSEMFNLLSNFQARVIKCHSGFIDFPKPSAPLLFCHHYHRSVLCSFACFLITISKKKYSSTLDVYRFAAELFLKNESSITSKTKISIDFGHKIISGFSIEIFLQRHICLHILSRIYATFNTVIFSSIFFSFHLLHS